MRLYEGVFIFPPASGPDAREKEMKSLEESIKKFGGVVAGKVDWGKRPIGYAVKKFKEGYFVVWDFQMPRDKVDLFRRALGLKEDLLKYMLTVKEEVMMKKGPEKKSPTQTAKVVQTTTTSQ